jgi:hypothetical protein
VSLPLLSIQARGSIFYQWTPRRETLLLVRHFRVRKLSQGVVYVASLLSLFANVVIPIAGIITPLGLGQEVRLSTGESMVQFSYSRDNSSTLADATTPRTYFWFSRLCGGTVWSLRLC